VRDISRRRAIEEELVRHRQHLEAIVEARTEELEASHERLRVSERMASIGTLAAGLGHDIKNLLFPVRCRLGSVEAVIRSQRARDDLAAVRQSLDYIQKLSDGLRLLTMDPNGGRGAAESTDLAGWWRDVEPLLSKCLRRGIALDVQFPPDLPRVDVAPHGLTQAMLNLVINAAEAMVDAGRIVIRARLLSAGAFVQISVRDDGIGMTPETQRHALDPFFTTKKRGLSTGLGLALVRGITENARGTIDIDSRQGSGTVVRLTLPAAPPASSAGAGRPAWRADVSIADERMAGAISMLLESEGFAVGRSRRPGADTVLWVTEEEGAFRRGDAPPRVIVINDRTDVAPPPGVSVVSSAGGLRSVRHAVHEAVRDLRMDSP
jgi:signal transduction histidine kinase